MSDAGEAQPSARVLLVGCSTETNHEFTRQLRAVGCSVETSGHAADALHKMGAAVDDAVPFELVIVEQEMPGIDAQMFAELVREDGQLSSVRLALLGQDDQGGFGPYAASGCDEQIATPSDALPLVQALGASRSLFTPDPEMPRPDAEAGASILLVDDNEINMEVAREMIEAIGYRCDHALDGFAAVEAAKRHPYDLVLMDCQMPGMDGYEATRRIRSLEEKSGGSERVPIVAVTAHAMSGDRERCLAVGMDDYMTKPVDASRLSAMIEKWLAVRVASRSREA